VTIAVKIAGDRFPAEFSVPRHSFVERSISLSTIERKDSANISAKRSVSRISADYQIRDSIFIKVASRNGVKGGEIIRNRYNRLGRRVSPNGDEVRWVRFFHDKDIGDPVAIGIAACNVSRWARQVDRPGRLQTGDSRQS